MDCRTARSLIDFARPRAAELDAAEARRLEGHLNGCAECEALARAERRADAPLARAMRAVPVPPGLRERLLARLEAEEAGRYRRRVAIPVGLAAAVALLLLTGVLGRLNRREHLDPRSVWQTAEAQVGAGAEQVERWLKEQGVNLPAPPQLNYHLLAFYQMADFQGRKVPQLVFVQHAAQGVVTARVYLLSDRHFDLRRLSEGDADSGRHGVRILTHPNNPHVAYLVLHTGDDRWFRLDGPPPA